MDKARKGSPARNTALLGVLFGLALALSLLESAVPLPIPVPGIRLGLSNIVVMVCLLYLGPGQAYALGALKALFAMMTRSGSAALMSLCGGWASITAMLLVRALLRRRENLVLLSIAGAVSHNLAQLAAFALAAGGGRVFWYYLPVLSAAGVLVGTLTAVLLRTLLPLLQRVRGGRP